MLAKMYFFGGVATCALILVAVAWTIPATSSVSPQWAITATGALYAVWAFIVWFRSYPDMRSLLRGESGERMTGDALDSLRSLGYEVFHDLPDETRDGRPCNIDHVAIGPGGVFVIESKFRSAAFDGQPIKVLPDRIMIGTTAMSPDPRHQALAATNSVRHRLAAVSHLNDVPVQAVIVLPTRKGGGVTHGFKSPDGVWVLTPGALVTTIKRQRPRLTSSEITALTAEVRLFESGLRAT